MIHLHRHSDFSLLDGAGTADQFAKRAAELGQSHLALTDHGTLAGILHHIRACEKHKITPICGIEAYFRPERQVKEKDYFHMVLLAANEEGWHNLMRISSEAYQSGYYYKPRMDYDLLERNSEGIIATTACMSGYSCKALMRDDIEDAEDHVDRLCKILDGRVYVELMPNTVAEQKPVNIGMANIAARKGLPVVATADAHFPLKEWADTQDVLVMINTNTSYQKRKEKEAEGEDTYEFGEPTLYLQSEEETYQLFKENHPDLPDELVKEAIANTHEIVNWIEPFKIDDSLKVPRISTVEKDKDAEQIVREWCIKGLEEKGYLGNKTYEDRMEEELQVMKEMDVFDYMYIVGDLVRWAKSQGIKVGVGRGSAGGSLVSYLTGIIGINPITHGLEFYRFLNPDRDTMPDIDLDFQDNRRHEVKEYLQKKWGKDHVVDIVAHSTFASKSALRDVSRVFDIPYEETLAVTKTMEESSLETIVTLEELRKTNPNVAAYAEKYPDVWKHANRLEGQVKAKSKHAAGVVVTDKPTAEYMPTGRGTDGEAVTEWSESRSYKTISTFGFLKLDVLGIRGLTTQDTIQRLARESGKEVDIDKLPFLDDPKLADPKVIREFGTNNTFGIFQFSSSGITNLLKHIRPDRFGDIVAANALYRPGPLEGGIAFEYGDRKRGISSTVYWNDAVIPFMEDTYGLLVYQEQVMQLVRVLAGFGKSESATVLKLITKAIQSGGREKIQAYYDKWVEGVKDKGISAQEADEIWSKIEAFCGYSFNRAHACGYAAHAYQDMHLKVHFPTEFWCAHLTHSPKSVARSIGEARAQGIKILPPDINSSERGFTIDGDAIRFGFQAVKNVGEAAIHEILTARKDGPFKSFEDFESRVQKRKCNKRVKEALAGAGAFDVFGARDDLTERQRGKQERELLGFALSTATDMQRYGKLIGDYSDDWDELKQGEIGQFGGEIIELSEKRTKKQGKLMAFLTLGSPAGRIDGIIFPQQYAKYQDVLSQGSAVMVKGKRDGDRLIVNNLCTVTELAEAVAGRGSTNGGGQ